MSNPMAATGIVTSPSVPGELSVEPVELETLVDVLPPTRQADPTGEAVRESAATRPC